ncbi:MAG: flavin monoamine oxidase family protein [Ktedonobacterales bacterium]
MPLDEPDCDVAIIGAGAAGLAAACLLTRHGFSVAVVEARNRIGGRLLTLRPRGSAIPIELGAAFVHGWPRETMELVESASAILYELGGQAVLRSSGQWHEDGWGKENPILSSLASYQGADCSLDAYIASNFAGPRWKDAGQRTRGYVAGFDAADPETVSVCWLAKTERAAQLIQGDRQFFLLDGYDRLMARLLDQSDVAQLKLHLNSVVRQLSWVPQRVTLQLVSAEGGTLPPITATRAIVTVPAGVLQSRAGSPGAIRFDPVPPALEEALPDIGMGDAAHVVIRLRDRFWDREPPSSVHYPQLSFLLSDHPVIPTWWTNYPLLVPYITGWVAGPEATSLISRPDGEIQAAATHALAEILGWSPAELETQVVESYFHNWSQDPYASGAYSYVKAGGLDHLAALAEPVEDTLYFAGEATNTEGHTGTVHGALATGERAARLILG